MPRTASRRLKRRLLQLRQRISDERSTRSTRVACLRDSAIIEISLLVPTSQEELAMISGVTPTAARGTAGASILAAVAEFLEGYTYPLPPFRTVRARPRQRTGEGCPPVPALAR